MFIYKIFDIYHNNDKVIANDKSYDFSNYSLGGRVAEHTITFLGFESFVIIDLKATYGDKHTRCIFFL